MKKLILNRTAFEPDGIFGEIHDEKGKLLFFTLEHSYDNKPKLPDGSYICERGIHRLSDLEPFETFEVLKVPGHTGILFHVGNYNRDSSGCILLGKDRGMTSAGKKIMITHSMKAFSEFMKLLQYDETFKLEVKS